MGAADRFLEDAGEENFVCGGAVDFVGWEGHGGELGVDGEEAVEGAVREGGYYFGGDVDVDSVSDQWNPMVLYSITLSYLAARDSSKELERIPTEN